VNTLHGFRALNDWISFCETASAAEGDQHPSVMRLITKNKNLQKNVSLILKINEI